MNEQLKDFFFDEVDRGRLVFEAFPEYNDRLSQAEALFPHGDLPNEIFQLLEISNCICLAHGLKLGLALKRWASL